MHASIATRCLALLPCISLVLVTAAVAPTACPPEGLTVRLPPYLDPALNSSKGLSDNISWIAPPDYFFSGTWYITNTSNVNYRQLSNLQWDIVPVIPSCKENSTTSCPQGTVAGVLDDISTWALDNKNGSKSPNFGAIGGGGRTAGSTVGWDIPKRLEEPELGPEWDGVYNYEVVNGPANGYRESWAFTYWGVDTKGTPFAVIHEGVSTINGSLANPPCLDVLSRSLDGVDPGSLTLVLQALEELGNEGLTKTVREMGATAWDGCLQGGPAICDKRCQTNGAEG